MQFIQVNYLRFPTGVGMRVTHQNLKILGTAGYRIPRKFQKLATVGYYWVSKKFLGTDLYRVPAKFSTMPTPGSDFQEEVVFQYFPKKNSFFFLSPSIKP